jgi:hypothetical protein
MILEDFLKRRQFEFLKGEVLGFGRVVVAAEKVRGGHDENGSGCGHVTDPCVTEKRDGMNRPPDPIEGPDGKIISRRDRWSARPDRS